MFHTLHSMGEKKGISHEFALDTRALEPKTLNFLFKITNKGNYYHLCSIGSNIINLQ